MTSRPSEIGASNPLGFTLVAIGIVATIVAVFLPEAHAPSASSSGLPVLAGLQKNTLIQSGDGYIFLALAALGALAAGRAFSRRNRAAAVIVIGLMTVGLAILEGRPSNLRYCLALDSSVCGTGSPAAGIFLVGIAGGLLTIGGLLLVRSSPRTVAMRSLKRCPECAEDVMSDANVCRYCGHRFEVV